MSTSETATLLLLRQAVHNKPTEHHDESDKSYCKASAHSKTNFWVGKDAEDVTAEKRFNGDVQIIYMWVVKGLYASAHNTYYNYNALLYFQYSISKSRLDPIIVF